MKRLTYILLFSLFSITITAQVKIKAKTDVAITAAKLTETKLASNINTSEPSKSNANAQIASLVGKNFMLYAVTKENFGFLCEVEATRRVGGRTTASLTNAIGNLHSTKYLWTLEKADAENTYYIKNALGEYLPKVPSAATEDIENPECTSTLSDRGKYTFVQYFTSGDDNAKWGIKSVDNANYYVQYNSYGDVSSNDEISICVIRSKDERHSDALADKSCVKFYICTIDDSYLESYAENADELLKEFKGIYSHFQGNERYVGALSKAGQKLLDDEIKKYESNKNDFRGAREALMAVNRYKNLPDPNKVYVIESAYSGFTGDLQAILEYDATGNVLKWCETTSQTKHNTKQFFQFEKISANIVGDVSGAGLYRIKCYDTNLYVGHASWGGNVPLVSDTGVGTETKIPLKATQAAVVELVEKENIPGQFTFPAHCQIAEGNAAKDYSTISLRRANTEPSTTAGATAVLSTYNGNWFSENQSNCFYIREVVELPALQPSDDGSTFVSTYALDGAFKVPTGVKAHKIDATSATQRADGFYNVTDTEVTGTVPANTGVLLTASEISEDPVYLIEKRSTTTSVTGNALFGVPERALVSEYIPFGWDDVVSHPYALARKDGIVAFYPYQPLSGYYAANHAFLDVSKVGISPELKAKGIIFEAPSASDGIISITPDSEQGTAPGSYGTINTTDAHDTYYYNITGQRINDINNYHGIVLHNGRKMVRR